MAELNTKHPCDICPVPEEGYEGCYGCAMDNWDSEPCYVHECKWNRETVCIVGISGKCKARHPDDFIERLEDDEE